MFSIKVELDKETETNMINNSIFGIEMNHPVL